MKRLPLTQGRHALLNDRDYEWAKDFKWHVTNGYAARAVWAGGRRTIYLHQEIAKRMGVGMVDHKNRDRLDCRRRNLRATTYSKNNGNVAPRASSGVLGVHRSGSGWQGDISRAGVRHRKWFKDFVEACEWAKATRQGLDGY